MSKARQRRGGYRPSVLIVLLLAVGLLAGGCVRVHAALAVSADDQVSGDVVVASQPSAQSSTGPQLAVPPSMTSRVAIRPYKADGYLGSDVTFQNLSFTELSALSGAISGSSGNYHIAFQRSGDLVTMSGSVDLSQLPPTGVDVQLKVNFPGRVTTATGNITDQTVSWTMKAGQVTSFSATDQYAIGNTKGWRFWALALGGGGGLIAAFVVLLALWARRRNLRKERAYLATNPTVI